MDKSWVGVAVLGCVLMCGVPAHAQSSSWGVSGGITPRWEIPSNAIKSLFDLQSVDLTGSDFHVGMVRGKEMGGDWGVSLVRRHFREDASASREADDWYEEQTVDRFGNIFRQPFPTQQEFTTTDTALLGLEIYKYANFATIKRRVQIGLLGGGGVGWMRGTVRRDLVVYNYDPSSEDGMGTERRRFSDEVVATELLRPFGQTVEMLPLARLELALGGIVAPGLKVRASGGFGMPAMQRFSLTAIYLFGAR
jgi:hypothetical protein